MKITSTITQKGQLTIPQGLRQQLKLQTYSKVYLEPAKDHLKIYPAQDILDLAGQLKPKVKKPVLKAREQFENQYQRF